MNLTAEQIQKEKEVEFATKEKIILVIMESYKKAKQNNFKDVNFSLTKNASFLAFLKSKIEILKKLDKYSQTFVSILTKAKITTREFQENKFVKNEYLEMLRLILTLPEELRNQNLRSSTIKEKTEKEISLEIKKEETKEKFVQKKKIKLVDENETGKKIFHRKRKEYINKTILNNISFD